MRPAVATFGTAFARLVEGRARRFLSVARRERVQAAFVWVYFLAGKFRFPARVFFVVRIVRERPGRRDRGERAADDQQSNDLAHSSSLTLSRRGYSLFRLPPAANLPRTREIYSSLGSGRPTRSARRRGGRLRLPPSPLVWVTPLP